MDIENGNNPFIERRVEIEEWKAIALDSLHISCALELDCKYFLTVDKGILKKTNLVNDIIILSPIDLILKLEDENDD